ncbi:hypothetical protein P3C29_29620 [Pseudomonas sp. 1912-s]|uniref:hypothetical protein n=1 Tax=Pseudomonas sp. 1912-s TaxID=3033802 RepID=UPI0023DF4D22|nr:hypothetical protein [Pseudomonas sp. 1912-s]MDF3202855.1 hypothetical protein [Pseudomonas sp. 1912-s]
MDIRQPSPIRINQATTMPLIWGGWKLLCLLLLACWGCGVGKAYAYTLNYSDLLSNGYSNCSYTKNADGTTTLGITISYNEASGHLGGATFLSRGVLIYTYDAKGVLNSSSRAATKVSLNGVVDAYPYVSTSGYVMYKNDSGRNVGNWSRRDAFLASITVQVQDSIIKDWPAIGIRAGNYTDNNDVGESAGVAYLSQATLGGECRILKSPDQPLPPVDTAITMTAPDWDLGELLRGEETLKSFSAAKDQLCFTYGGAKYITFQKFIINATNANGLSADRSYQLKNLEDSSQTVPYTVALNSGSSLVQLPNTRNAVVSLSDDGRMCFDATFKVKADRTVKGGAYSDVLTFTVVAKP